MKEGSGENEASTFVCVCVFKCQVDLCFCRR